MVLKQPAFQAVTRGSEISGMDILLDNLIEPNWLRAQFCTNIVTGECLCTDQLKSGSMNKYQLGEQNYYNWLSYQDKLLEYRWVQLFPSHKYDYQGVVRGSDLNKIRKQEGRNGNCVSNKLSIIGTQGPLQSSPVLID